MSKNPNPVRHSIWSAPDGHEYALKDIAPDAWKDVHITASGVACAIAHDPNNCGAAVSWGENPGCTVAQFGTMYVYLGTDRVDPITGRRIAWRGKLGTKAREALDAFDRSGGTVFPLPVIRVGGIPASDRLDSKRQVQKRVRTRWVEAGKPAKKKAVRTHIRNAERRAQTHVLKGEGE